MRGPAYIILAVLTCLALPAASQAFLADKIEAVVNEKVITKSEVDRAARAEAGRRGEDAGGPEAGLWAEALDALIDRTFLLEEARRFNLVQVSGGEVEQALAAVKKGFGTEEEYRRALEEDEMTEEELKEDIEDRLLAAKYVDRRVKSIVNVTLDEQRKFYEENRDRFGGRPFEEAQAGINELLAEREAAGKLDEYLKELRRKARVKIYH